MHTGRIPTGNLSGWSAILPDKQILLFLWSVANKKPYRFIRLSSDRRPAAVITFSNVHDSSRSVRRLNPTSHLRIQIFDSIPEIPLKRVHSKRIPERIPKFSKTFPGIFTVPDRKSRNFWSNGKRPLSFRL